VKRWRQWLLYAEASVLTVLMAAALLLGILGLIH
jgi:hypothetical protein